MSKENIFPISHLFIELSELEQSSVCGGFTATNTKDEIIDNSHTVSIYDTTQLSGNENFTIDDSLNNLLGSSTFSLSVDTTLSSGIFVSGESLRQISSNFEVFSLLPKKHQQEIVQFLDSNTLGNNTIDNFALSITHYYANIQGTETFNLSGSAGNIITSSNWSLTVDTAAVSGIFFPQKSSIVDVSNVVPENNQITGTQLMNENTAVSNFGLSFTYYSADFQQTEVSKISGLSGSGFTSSTQSMNIDTEALSGIYISEQVSIPFILSGRDKQGITNIDGQNISNNFVINESLASSDNLLLSLNTTSGIRGSQADLSASWERINYRYSDVSENISTNLKYSDIDSLLENNFGASFGFSTSSYNVKKHNTKSYRLSGNVSSTEELVSSILGIIPNDNENIQYFPSSDLTLGSSTNLPIISFPIDIPLNSGLNSNSSGIYLENILENISNFRVISNNNNLFANVNYGNGDNNININKNNFNILFTRTDFTAQLRKLEQSYIELKSEALYPQIIYKSNHLFIFQSSVNILNRKNNYLELANTGIGNYAFSNSDTFNFSSTNIYIGGINQNLASNLSTTFQSKAITNTSRQNININDNSRFLISQSFVLFAVSNFEFKTLASEKNNVPIVYKHNQKNPENQQLNRLFKGSSIFKR